MSTQLNITRYERKEKVFSWLRQNGLTYAALAEQLGVTAWWASKLFDKTSIPTARHKQLRDMGVPEDLLPPARDISTGPKLRHHQNHTEA